MSGAFGRPARARPRRAAAWAAVLAAALTLAVAAIGQAAPSFPTLSGRVVDEAGIIPEAIEADLDAKLAALEARTTDQFVVVTLSSLQGYEIADYGYQLGRAWAIGQKDKDNGLLLIVAPAERKVRFEVGYGLEGTMTDAIARVIIDNAILPRFRANDMTGGIVRGVDDAIQVLAGEAPEIRQLAERRSADDGLWTSLIPFLIFLAIAIIIINIVRHGGGTWTPGSGWSSGSSGGGSWSGGSSGGGFSGGGGSFGGGGSSGSW